jgi:hypothetical protein
MLSIYYLCLQVCGEEGRVEVILYNPLAVPVKVESLTLQAEFQASAVMQMDLVQGMKREGPEEAGAPTSVSLGGAPKSVDSSDVVASCNVERSANGQPTTEVPQYWRPAPLTALLLPPNGKPVRVTLSGTPLLPGALSLTGITINAFGAQWLEPFSRDGKRVRLPSLIS